MNREISCSITGHRPEKLPWGNREEDPRCLSLKETLLQTLESYYVKGYRHFLSGMARGTDLYFCELVLQLKAQHPNITLEAVIPYAGQADLWPCRDRLRYTQILAQCDFETVVQHSYSQGCLQRRNRYLVDHAACLIGVYNGRGGGTLYTLRYGLEQGIDVTVLDV